MKRGLLLALLVLNGCASPSREPENLQWHKRALMTYVDSGEYDRQLAIVARQATQWVEERSARGGEKLAVVFDLDETLLRNWPQIRGDDFGFVWSRWEAWVQAAKAPAIEPVREVYRVARRLGVAAIFITGRIEGHRAATEANLRSLDLGDFAVLVCRPAEKNATSGDFKTAVRRQLVADGWVIIANIGDQKSDLAGGYAERGFKLPNPFYETE